MLKTGIIVTSAGLGLLACGAFSSSITRQHYTKSPIISKLRDNILADVYKERSIWNFLSYGPSHEWRFWKAVDDIKFKEHDRLATQDDMKYLAKLQLDFMGETSGEKKEDKRQSIVNELENLVFLRFVSPSSTTTTKTLEALSGRFDFCDVSYAGYNYRPDSKIMLIKIDPVNNFNDYESVLFDWQAHAGRITRLGVI